MAAVPTPPAPRRGGTKKRPHGMSAGTRVASLDGRRLGRVNHRRRDGQLAVEWESGGTTLEHESALLKRYTEQSKSASRNI